METMTRYRVTGRMDRDNEQHLSDDADRAVDDEYVYILEPTEDD